MRASERACERACREHLYLAEHIAPVLSCPVGDRRRTRSAVSGKLIVAIEAVAVALRSIACIATNVCACPTCRGWSMPQMLQHNQQPCGVIAERANDVIANVEIRHQRQTVTQNGTCAALQL